MLLVAAVGLLVVKRESVADGWLRIMLPALTAAERERADALAAFSRERFAVAAQSDDPRQLAAAARYLHWVEARRADPRADAPWRTEWPEDAAGAADALIRRAAILGADDPVVWSQLAQICEHGWLAVPKRDCPAEAAGSIERLVALEPDNGWSALLELARLAPDSAATVLPGPGIAAEAREAAIDAALARLAASARVDGHEAAILEVHRRIFERADWPPTLVGSLPAREWATGTFGAALVLLFAPDGWSIVGNGPPYANAETARDVVARLWLFNDQRLLGGGLTTACRGELSDARLAHCRRAAHVLARGSTLVDETVGLRIAIRLAPDPESAEAARGALRQRRWQMEQQLKLVDQDSSAFLLDSMARVTELWIETGREGEAYARLLAEQGLATTPPPGWTAPDEEHWSQ
jgi:hypothetical protein